ncbi:MAG: right-handed parallel beta-helix repeat-containing protein, partial [Planctomycetota bacterium]|nr:right-handed parallel beta-helix repeat-containing protein [Planctomycetota bacterium]
MGYNNRSGGKQWMRLLLMLAWLVLPPQTLRAANAPSRTPMPKRPTPAVTLFIATSGDDANAGTREQPFATLQRARDEIRKLKQRGLLSKGGVAVQVAGGRYKVAKTFTLGTEDSGTETAPIVYRAVEGEMPTFTGGLRLKGFQPVSDTAILERLPEEARGKVVRVDLASHGLGNIKPLSLGGFASGRGFKTHPVMELFFDGRPLPLARWPNDGFVHIADVQLDGHKIHGRAGSKTGRFTYRGERPNRWKDDKDAMLYGYWFFGWADSYEPVASIDTKRREITLKPPYHKYGYRKGQPYYAINLLSEIDQPGEWYLDRGTAALYLYPPSDPNKAVLELSTVDYPFVEMKDVSHVSFERFVWEFGGGDVVRISGGEHCLLAGCTIRHCGGNGVAIRGGRNHGLLSCDIYSLGRGGVAVDGGNRKTLAPGGHFVENCHIHNLSRIDHTYTPAVWMGGVGNRIVHNRLHDIRSSAIRLGGNDHLVEFNEVFDVVWESDDQGGADMFGNATYRGNVYRYNYWHHIGIGRGGQEEPACGRAGIRLDDAISGTLIFGNVFYRCSAGKLGFGG